MATDKSTRVSLEDIDKRIIEIDNNANPSSPYYGKLLRWWSSPDSKWHFGIGLSDSCLFDTGINYNLIAITDSIILEIDGTTEGINFSNKEVIQRLKHALYCFEKKKFHSKKWNDEHLAKLIARDYPKSGIFEINAAKEKFYNYLQKYSPSLNPDLFHIVAMKIAIESLAKILQSLIRRKYVAIAFLLFFGVLVFAVILNQTNIAVSVLYIIIFYLVIRLILKLYRWKGSGFSNKGLWDWLDLLLVPAILAMGGFFLENRVQERQSYNLEEQNRQESLKNYINQVQGIVSENSISNSLDKLTSGIENIQINNINDNLANTNKPTLKIRNTLIGKKNSDGIQTINNLSNIDKQIVESLTLVVLDELDSKRKHKVIRLLSKLRLINITRTTNIDLDKCSDEYNKIAYPSSQISLSTANLIELYQQDDLNIDLRCVNFRGANLRNVIFNNTDLSYADFREKADLTNVSFKDTKILGAKFGTTTILKKTKFPQGITIIDEANDSDEIKRWKLVLSLILAHYQENKNQKWIKSIFKLDEDKKCPQNSQSESFQEIIKDLRRLTKDLRQLSQTELNNVNFSKLDLQNLVLKDSQLICANLEKTNLQYAYLENANLENANLKGTILKNVSLQSANLQGANLENAKLEGANLENANLKGTILKNVSLKNANLKGAILKDAKLEDSNLEGANLEGTNLEGAILKNIFYLESTNLQDNNLEEANLQGASLKGANLKGTNLQGANLKGANLQRTNLQGANLQNADLQGAILNSANLKDAILEDAILQNSELIAANLNNSKVKNVKWKDACYVENSTKFPSDFNPQDFNLNEIKQGDVCKKDR